MTRPNSPATVVSSQIPASKRQGRVAGHGGRHRARGGHRNNEYGLARRTPAGAARTTPGRMRDDSDDSPGFPAPSPVSSLLRPLCHRCFAPPLCLRLAATTAPPVACRHRRPSSHRCAVSGRPLGRRRRRRPLPPACEPQPPASNGREGGGERGRDRENIMSDRWALSFI